MMYYAENCIKLGKKISRWKASPRNGIILEKDFEPV